MTGPDGWGDTACLAAWVKKLNGSCTLFLVTKRGGVFVLGVFLGVLMIYLIF
jgi:hypothetical protein